MLVHEYGWDKSSDKSFEDSINGLLQNYKKTSHQTNLPVIYYITMKKQGGCSNLSRTKCRQTTSAYKRGARKLSLTKHPSMDGILIPPLTSGFGY